MFTFHTNTRLFFLLMHIALLCLLMLYLLYNGLTFLHQDGSKSEWAGLLNYFRGFVEVKICHYSYNFSFKAYNAHIILGQIPTWVCKCIIMGDKSWSTVALSQKVSNLNYAMLGFCYLNSKVVQLFVLAVHTTVLTTILQLPQKKINGYLGWFNKMLPGVDKQHHWASWVHPVVSSYENVSQCWTIPQFCTKCTKVILTRVRSLSNAARK